MDKRTTFNGLGELQSLLTTLFREKSDASLLVDDKGLTRINGIITNIESASADDNSSIQLNNTESISLKNIIAVNGVFRAEYTEC